jgi:hypothetical protein
MDPQPLMTTSPISNQATATVRIAPRERLVFSHKPGHFYNHHHQLTALDGRLFATWSSAPVNEDEPGQRMMLATSDDQGMTWSEARTLLAAPAGAHGPVVLTSMGIHVHGEVLVAYCGSYDYTAYGAKRYRVDGCNGKGRPEEPFHQDSHTKILVSHDRGATWKQEGRIDGFVPNLRPQPLRSGRLVMPGNMWYPYTDDPSGMSGWTVAGIPRLPAGYHDDPDGFWYGRKHRNDAHASCEGSFFQTADDAVHMMLRTETGRLAVSTSRDNGANYSEPQLTSYSDGNCRFHFGRLPDGRWFGLNCPDPRPEEGTTIARRTPMVLATSIDGVAFSHHNVLGDAPSGKPQQPGFHKHGRYGYPSYHISGDTFFAIFSVHKEDIACVSCPLSSLI